MNRIACLPAALGLCVALWASAPGAVEGQLSARDATAWSWPTPATPASSFQLGSLPLQSSTPSCRGSAGYRSLCGFLSVSGGAFSAAAEGTFGSVARGYPPFGRVGASPFDAFAGFMHPFQPCDRRPASPCGYGRIVAPETTLAAGLLGSLAGYLVSEAIEDEVRRGWFGPIPRSGPR